MTQQMNAAVGDWFKNNLITVMIVIGGFVGTVWQLKGDVGNVQTQVTGLQNQITTQGQTLQSIQYNQTEEKLSYKGLSDQIDVHSKDIEAINKHLQAIDATAMNEKDTIATILTNQSLINQQIQFLSTQKSFIGDGTGKNSGRR